MDLQMCRVCCKNKGVSNIFSTDNKISAQIKYCCSKINITEGDGLPSRICSICETELTTAYLFVLKCEAADKNLRLQAAGGCQDKPTSEFNCMFKVKVKLEEVSHSDHDSHYDDFAPLDLKQDLEIKPETELKGNIERSCKKNIKYKIKEACTCQVCGRSSASRSALAIHMRSHTGEVPYPCPNCEKKYKDQGSLKRHINRHHFEGERQRNYTCENCGKGFFSKNDVKIHMRTHTGETPYLCPECPMKFTQTSALLRHRKRHSGEKPHGCSTCTKKFCTKEELKLHLRVHTDEKKFHCTICNVLFKYQNSLKKHIILHSDPNSFVCNYCGRTFNQKGNLKSHIDRQHSEKSGYCNICCKNMSNIEVHMWRHTGQRPLKCELCSSSFFELKSLARHVNYRHKNPDKFKCLYEGCSMTFPSRPMLDFHKAKRHETRIPFPCDRCPRGFYRKNDLARHKIGTHKERLVG